MDDRPLVFIDFEYGKQLGSSLPAPLAMVVITEAGDVHRFRLDHSLPLDPPIDLDDYIHVHWHSWAELSCYWVADWPFPEYVIDAAVEYGCARNFDFEKDQRPRRGLMHAARYYGIETKYADHEKERYQAICAAWDGRPIEDSLMNEILDYCEEDVRLLVEIYRHVGLEPFPEPYRSLRRQHAALRGEHMKIATKIFCRGVPIDENVHTHLDENRAGITERLIGFLRKDFPGVLGKSGFLQKGFGEYLEKFDLLDDWPRSPKSGLLVTSRSVLKERAALYPQLNPLLEVSSVKSLMSKYKVKMDGDGRARVLPNEFHAISSRANPTNTKYPLSTPKIFRNVIKAPEGKMIAQVDYASMEYGVGASLSGDRNRLAAYNRTDIDVYVAAGVLAGMTVEQAKRNRQRLKQAELASQYGQRAWGLAQTLKVSQKEAQHLLDLAHTTFSRYFGWCKVNIEQAREKGYLITQGGWRMNIHDQSRDNLLMNWPTQSESQEIFRAAVLEIDRANICIIGLNHDSVLLEIESEAEAHQAAMIMSDTAQQLLGLRLRAEVEIMEPTRSALWSMILAELDSSDPAPSQI